MAKLRVHNMSMSLDGYVAGPNQSLDNPLGERGEELHEWIFETRAGRKMTGQDGGKEGVDNDLFAAGFDNIGSWILGRNMFGPIRGDWPDDEWKGWWGDTPPYHCDVFVLTHHKREPFSMDGGTTFHFATDGIESALEQAFESAKGADVRIGGGASTVQQYVQAGLVDEMHVPVVPVFFGAGEQLFEGLGDTNYEVAEVIPSENVVHYRFTRKR